MKEKGTQDLLVLHAGWGLGEDVILRVAAHWRWGARLRRAGGVLMVGAARRGTLTPGACVGRCAPA
jgi:hypothetical protein